LWRKEPDITIIIIIQFNSLFIYVLSSTAGGQLQSQHGKQIQQTEHNNNNNNNNNNSIDIFT
jgi:hypothetical protein